jgi:hypothetical protein
MPGYGVPKDRKDLLAWSHAEERLERAQQYWVTTSDVEGAPHAVPVWGLWIDGALYFGGGPEIRWTRNLRHNPRVAVHLESGEDVVILEGTADWFEDANDPVVKRLDELSREKYAMPSEGVPCWRLRPAVAFGWTLARFPKDATRWQFDDPT